MVKCLKVEMVLQKQTLNKHE
jgi:hypothetical protein